MAPEQPHDPGGPGFLVLHAVRVRGLAPEPYVADMTGLTLEDATTTLVELAAGGLTRHRDGRLAGWQLTAEGRVAHHSALATVTTDVHRERLSPLYEEFSALNQTVKQLCTDWQLRPEGSEVVVNDHADAGYDAGVTSRLIDVHSRATDLTGRLSAGAPRFGPYGPRLDRAIERLRGGDRAAFAQPLANSYHDVWMELHEDLLLTLGLARGDGDA